MTSWILMPVRNALHLTRDAIDDCLAQDVGDVRVLVVNDGSTDGTREYLATRHPDVWAIHHYPPKGVSYAWNRGLRAIFNTGVDDALVVNNDIRLRPDTLRTLRMHTRGFSTCVGTSDGALFPGGDCTGARRPHPDFSCFLISRGTWEKVGEFDETMKIYASDGDYHLRMHQAGIEAFCIDLPFHHVASGTIKSVSQKERDEIGEQGNRDRDAFKKKWGCPMGSPDYYRMFEPADVVARWGTK